MSAPGAACCHPAGFRARACAAAAGEYSFSKVTDEFPTPDRGLRNEAPGLP